MKKTKTEQESFWAGEFGIEYSKRNKNPSIVTANTVFFSKIFSHVRNVGSIIEFGANIGLNLSAIKNILPAVDLSAVEINSFATEELKKNVSKVKIYHQSILDFKSERKWDFVLVKTVLIHINPRKLEEVYDVIYNASSKYICLAEYYNPVPVEVNYRGHSGKLFKRDFAGELLARYKDLRLVDYGFAYHNDSVCPLDDINWFLFEKK